MTIISRNLIDFSAGDDFQIHWIIIGAAFHKKKTFFFISIPVKI